MAELTTKGRNRLADKKFALPEERKYPIEDRAHAANAKVRASMENHKGKMSRAEFDKINAAADAVLKKGKGGK